SRQQDVGSGGIEINLVLLAGVNRLAVRDQLRFGNGRPLGGLGFFTTRTQGRRLGADLQPVRPGAIRACPAVVGTHATIMAAWNSASQHRSLGFIRRGASVFGWGGYACGGRSSAACAESC